MSVFKLKTYEQIIALPDKEWYVSNLFGPQDLVMVFGREGRGKTFIVIDLIASLLSQNQFANEFDVIKPISVIYTTDEGTASIPSRFKAAFRKHDIFSTDSLLITYNMVQLFDKKSKLNVEQFILDIMTAGTRPGVIIIDTLYNAAIGSNENSVTDAGIVIDSAKRLRDKFSCAVLFIHHSDKSGRWPRGASSYLGSMDCIVEVDKGKISCYKMKDAAKFTSIGFELEANEYGVQVNWTGEAKETGGSAGTAIMAALEKSSEPMTVKAISLASSVSPSTAARTLNILVDEGLVLFSLKDPSKARSSSNPMMYWRPSALHSLEI